MDLHERILKTMSYPLVSFLSLLLLLAGSCGPETVTQKGPWSLKLTTSGGFAGVGRGKLSVDSKGTMSYEAPARPNEIRTSCTGTLYNDKLRPISDAVAQANPKEWNSPELNVAAPDAFGYKLELLMGSDLAPDTVQWYDNTKDKLPPDLKRLSEVLLQTMKSECWPGNPDSGKP